MVVGEKPNMLWKKEIVWAKVHFLYYNLCDTIAVYFYLNPLPQTCTISAPTYTRAPQQI